VHSSKTVSKNLLMHNILFKIKIRWSIHFSQYNFFDDKIRVDFVCIYNLFHNRRKWVKRVWLLLKALPKVESFTAEHFTVCWNRSLFLNALSIIKSFYFQLGKIGSYFGPCLRITYIYIYFNKKKSQRLFFLIRPNTIKFDGKKYVCLHKIYDKRL
jgi:hypothetical protein